MHHDWIIFSGDGKFTGRDTFIQQVRSGDLQHSIMNFQTLRVSVYENTGLIVQKGISAGVWKGHEFSNEEISSTVYIKDHHVWLAVQTMIVEAKS